MDKSTAIGMIIQNLTTLKDDEVVRTAQYFLGVIQGIKIAREVQKAEPSA